MATVFCDPSLATGSNNGTSWENAYQGLQAAIDAAGSGDEVWVKARTVTLTVMIDVDNANNNNIYGGFDNALTGTNGSVVGRTSGVRTILDGNNLYQCMEVAVPCTVDGFKLINGDSSNVGGVEIDLSGAAVLRNFEIWDCNGEICGGCYIVAASTVLLDNCVIDGCVNDNSSSTLSYGGGIYLAANSCAVTMEDCTINENTATLDGGGIYSDNSTTLDCTDCTFTTNGTTGASGFTDGGCIYNYQNGDMTFTRCKFSGNYTSGTGFGGAFFCWDANVDLINCVFDDNSADSGGVCANYGTCDITFTNCTIADNTCSSSGGGAAFNDTGYTLVNSILWNNLEDGVVVHYSDSISATYCNVEGGESGTGNVNDDPEFFTTGDDPYDILTSNSGVDSGNASATDYPSTDILGRARVDDTNTTNTGNGTPAYSDMGAYEYQIPAKQFVDPSATGGNNGTTWEDAFTSLQAAIDQVAYSTVQLWVKSRTITLTARIDFDNSNANAIYGGFDNSLTGTNGSVVGRNVPTNLTILDGGNTYACGYVNNQAHTIDGFKFYDGNVATAAGLYCYITSGTIKIANCVFDSCSGTTGGAVYGTGGGNVDFDDCSFTNNSASTNGGGVYFSGTSFTMDNCTFTGNSSSSGTSSVRVTSSGADCIMTDCVVYSNTSSAYNGGAIGAGSSSTLTCVRVKAYSNTGSTIGGAIRCDGGSTTWKNCIIYSNSSTYGGAAYLSGGTHTFDNCTMADNTAGTGSCIRNTGGATTTLTNCIVWGGSSAAFADAATLTVTYSNVHGTGTYTGTGNVNDDPLFVGSGDDYYDLSASSECVDSGNSGATNYTSTDYLGRARVDDPDTTNTGAGSPAYSDMGAYEYQPTVSDIVTSLLLALN